MLNRFDVNQASRHMDGASNIYCHPFIIAIFLLGIAEGVAKFRD